MCDDGTIGDLTSGASNLASATTQDLFYLLWNNLADAEAAVSTGRGVTAAADYAAHKTIALPKMLSRVFGVAGAGAGLTSRVLGKTFGEENHALTEAENASHTHTGGAHTHAINSTAFSAIAATPGSAPYALDTAQNNFGTGGSFSQTQGSTVSDGAVATASSGSGTAHNTMQPTVFLNMMIKL